MNLDQTRRGRFDGDTDFPNYGVGGILQHGVCHGSMRCPVFTNADLTHRLT